MLLDGLLIAEKLDQRSENVLILDIIPSLGANHYYRGIYRS